MENKYAIVPEAIVHTNENYFVVVNTDADGYGVYNRATGVTEFEAISMPECIFAAENLNVVLVHATWEWVNKRAEAQAAEDRVVSGKSGLNLVN